MIDPESNSSPEDFFDPANFVFQVPSSVDDKAAKEALFFNGDLSDADIFLKIERFKLKKQNEDSERKLREKNAKLAYKFSKNWAIFIGCLIIVYGFIPRTCFKLSQTEFLFVIGTLTASILTYYLLVIKYLFYRPKENNESI